MKNVTEFTPKLNGKCTHQNQFIGSLPISGHVEHTSPTRHRSDKTTSNGDGLYNAVSLALVGEERHTSLLCLLVALLFIMSANNFIL